MSKKTFLNSVKLIQYYKLINHNLIYNNKAINRYKRDNFEISDNKADNLERLKKSIRNIKNCSLKSSATNMVFSDGNPKSKIIFTGGSGQIVSKDGNEEVKKFEFLILFPIVSNFIFP